MTDVKDEIANALTIKEAIGLAMGAASSCWENLQGAGTFESERASELVDVLYDRMMDRSVEIPVAVALQTLSNIAKDGSREDHRIQAANSILRFAIDQHATHMITESSSTGSE